MLIAVSVISSDYFWKIGRSDKVLKVLRVLKVLKVRQMCLYPYSSFRSVVFVLNDVEVIKRIVSRSGEISKQ